MFRIGGGAGGRPAGQNSGGNSLLISSSLATPATHLVHASAFSPESANTCKSSNHCRNRSPVIR